MMSKYILFDIDGCLADNRERQHYAREKNFASYYSKVNMLKDKPIEAGLLMLEALLDTVEIENEKINLTILTARNQSSRVATREWLDRELGYDYKYNLVMRKRSDRRPAHEVKEDYVKSIGAEDILFAVDDDPAVVEMYTRNGVICFQPNTNFYEEKQ